MKKLLLLVLACGMFVSAFAQPEVSDKWVIIPVTNMKGVLGKLDINFPADIERNILIYQQADNKFLRSVSRNDKTYTITPGDYRFTLTNVPVENVPIKKGHETRLKAGFLDIVSEGDWHLYDETKEKAYTSGNKPKKLALPVGRYQIKLGGQFYPVIIKDGETVEDSSPVEIKNEIPGMEGSLITETDKWVITPVQGGIPNGKGRLIVHFNAGIYWDLRLTTSGISGTSTGVPFHPADSIKSYDLPPDEYTFRFTGIIIPDVPITNGFETRLKGGILNIVANSTFSIDHNGAVVDYSLVLSGPIKMLVPVGSYIVRLGNGQVFTAIVKDERKMKF